MDFGLLVFFPINYFLPLSLSFSLSLILSSSNCFIEQQCIKIPEVYIFTFFSFCPLITLITPKAFYWCDLCYCIFSMESIFFIYLFIAHIITYYFSFCGHDFLFNTFQFSEMMIISHIFFSLILPLFYIFFNMYLHYILLQCIFYFSVIL